MQYLRNISDNLRNLSTHFPVVVLTGARQVGKTTLLKSCFPEYTYVSLDLPSVAEAAESEPSTFWQRYPAPVIIDEVQYAPKLFRFLKAQVDQNRHAMGQYILTGSQKFPLMKEITESLAGRVGVLELETLSLKEVGPQTAWASIMARGFYPELWRQPTLKASDFFASYIATYLERDVRQLLNVSSLRDFERFLRALAVRSGQLLNRTDLARDVGISTKTAGEWIQVLHASDQLSILEPYFENLGKRLVKSPKVYLNDSGLLCFLLGLDENSVLASPLVGAIWETFVYAELRKRHRNAGNRSSSLWFFRDGQGHELDFLNLETGRMNFIECKWTENPAQGHLSAFQFARSHLSRSKAFLLGDDFMVCRTREPYRLEDTRIINPNDL